MEILLLFIIIVWLSAAFIIGFIRAVDDYCTGYGMSSNRKNMECPPFPYLLGKFICRSLLMPVYGILYLLTGLPTFFHGFARGFGRDEYDD